MGPRANKKPTKGRGRGKKPIRGRSTERNRLSALNRERSNSTKRKSLPDYFKDSKKRDNKKTP